MNAVERSARRGLSSLGPPYLGLVAIEFLLGMALNVYVALPGGSPLHILESTPLLDVHFVLGFLLLGISARAVALAARAADRPALAFTALGLLSGVAAFLAGLEFAFGGGSASASYIMSLGFVGLLITAGFLLSRRGDGQSAPRAGGVSSPP
jgi:hypothetical protein